MERTLEGIKRYIHFDATELPELKDWKVGEKYLIQLVVKQKTKVEEDEMPMHADFEIHEISAGGAVQEKEERSLAGSAPYLPLGDLGGQDK